MDLITTRTRGNPSLSTKSHESDTDTETPLQTHLSKALSLTNGSLVRHQQAHTPPPPPPPEPLQQQMVVSYRECLKNHAASIGGVALDGCGEFMPTPTATLLDPTSLKCAACGCHRNFHRRDHQPQHPPLPVALHWTSSPSPSSGPSPSPSSPASPTPHQSVYPSAPHMLLALSAAGQSGLLEENHHHHHYHQNPMVMDPHGRKRARTKFTEEQRKQMQSFAEKLGWKMLRGNDEKTVENFCNEVGVKRNVFKVWMHNNKHRREKGNVHLDKINVHVNEERVGFVSYNINENTNSSSSNHNYDDNLDRYKIIKSEVHVHGSTTTDGSSPSSS